ncbi:conserved Plasmodium protein, unknown function [Plasmodium berghei]|uniref:Fam-b protein n=2 Tax=Plasmodium berghei TaxID=5821 RepID=A0A509AGP5_PLABA|nr:conserved Plasmodium protein, unknown function [Plasmodium berghei ANKA]CXI13430.1 conserved Plasmodium protein, unknown function [Plasmodium berghei]SCL93507.1 conserved Plasmodium protein, unknown function [Plasmodium berghei]SCM15878.1 conserved Plasmodium protein, unknown function [Plasmodium berghei]SCM17674.1 conserved Plasmodium protein, unknown function [Plasmodium berghei]SCN23228.1 conserved Plasmodium protein, unknown function [Plasmodium berghei]|eukprot:XP_034420482.1 conserved Plasmodium protein, unknown function [Plasmodium berghei ANKA]
MSYKKLIFLIVFILALSIKNVDSVIIISPILNFFDKIFGVKRMFNWICNIFRSKKKESLNDSTNIKSSNNLSDQNIKIKGQNEMKLIDKFNKNNKNDVTEKPEVIGPDHELYQKMLNRYITTQEDIDNKIIKRKEDKEKEEELNKLWPNKIKNIFFKKKETKMPSTLIEYISDKNKKIIELEIKADTLLSKCIKYKIFFFGTTMLLILLSSFPFLLYSYVDYINDGHLTTRFNKIWNRNSSILEEKEKYHNSFEYKVHKRIMNYRSSTYFKMLDLNVSLSEIDGIVYLQLSF